MQSLVQSSIYQLSSISNQAGKILNCLINSIMFRIILKLKENCINLDTITLDDEIDNNIKIYSIFLLENYRPLETLNLRVN